MPLTPWIYNSHWPMSCFRTLSCTYWREGPSATRMSDSQVERRYPTRDSEDNLLRDHPAHADAHQMDVFPPEMVYYGDGILCHHARTVPVC
jgi:hypothetical protein